MGFTYTFESLDVLKLSKELVKEIYHVTSRFPKQERFGLIDQINRAAVSVASNVAEGTSRTTGKEQARFTQIAYGSMIEVLCQLIISQELGYLSIDSYKLLRDKIEIITKKLNYLRDYQLKN